MSEERGNWEVVTLSGISGPYAIKMPFGNTDKTYYGVQMIHKEEDARLIAAAPDLYEAANEAYELLTGGGDAENGSVVYTEEELAKIARKLWGAIEKAEGVKA